jgi:rhodanese-related sulfurtransferase
MMVDLPRTTRQVRWLLTIGALSMIAAACAAKPATTEEQAPPSAGGENYRNLTAVDLHDLLQAGDVFLVNVHVPYEGEIPGTDASIAFDQIQEQLSAFPQSRSASIVVYCRSGSMSKTAAQSLVQAGYRQVSNLPGGYRAWIAQGYGFLKQ